MVTDWEVLESCHPFKLIAIVLIHVLATSREGKAIKAVPGILLRPLVALISREIVSVDFSQPRGAGLQKNVNGVLRELMPVNDGRDAGLQVLCT